MVARRPFDCHTTGGNSRQQHPVGDGETLSLTGDWSNTATINVSGGTLNLGGSFTQTELGTIVRSGGTVNLTGTGFKSFPIVTVGGVLTSATLVSPTSITVTTPAGPVGPVDVVVTNSAGCGAALRELGEWLPGRGDALASSVRVRSEPVQKRL